MKTFSCTHCGHRVFFENTVCTACGATLGYIPALGAMAAFEVAPDGVWRSDGVAGAWRPCRNYRDAQVCNWMLAADDPEALCSCCRHTEVIPDLTRPDNHRYWALLEAAKRRLCHGLDALGLARPGPADDPERGLRFHFLETLDPASQVLTGHDSGLVTLNVAEADDAEREARRSAMGEPYRTLLGHFRHESGHFYWDRLVADGPWLAGFRAHFGDERADYAAALQQHYAAGPADDWPQRFVSAYASAHPWEDWAETWAHYLHVVDALDTAAHWGLHLAGGPDTPAGDDPGAPAAPDFRARLVHGWLPLSRFLNSMNRSLGQADSYPFVLPDPVLAKLAFIHALVGAAAGLPWTHWPPSGPAQAQP